MNIQTIWLVAITVFLVIQQLGDIKRWGQVGAQINVLTDATKTNAESLGKAAETIKILIQERQSK